MWDAEEYDYDDVENKTMLGAIDPQHVHDNLVHKNSKGVYVVTQSPDAQNNRKQYDCVKFALLEMETWPYQINPAVKQCRLSAAKDLLTIYMFCSHLGCPTTLTVHIHLFLDENDMYPMEVIFASFSCEHVDGLSAMRPVVVHGLEKSSVSNDETAKQDMNLNHVLQPRNTPLNETIMAINKSVPEHLITCSSHAHHVKKGHYTNLRKNKPEDYSHVAVDTQSLICKLYQLAQTWYEFDVKISNFSKHITKEFQRMVGFIHDWNPLMPMRVSLWHRSAFTLVKYLGMFTR